MGGFKVTFRQGPSTEHARCSDLDEALAWLEARLPYVPRRDAVDVRSRRFEPIQQVAARGELRGEGAAGGLDVRGDGSIEAWTGRWRRTTVAQRDGEPAQAALRRALGSTSAGP